jgi:uncharacterized membrane protein
MASLSDRVADREARAGRFVARIMRSLGKHWLLLANVVMLLYIGLPLLAPLLAHGGEAQWAARIHTLFSPFCHQLPERSFFLYGPQSTYSRDELLTLVGDPLSLRYAGSAIVGYKMAICQRCAAIYSAWLLLGVFFTFTRLHIRPLRPRSFALLLVPIAVDGVGQLVGAWTSTWQSRIATGALFALAIVWLTYPYIEQGMREMVEDAERSIGIRNAP